MSTYYSYILKNSLDGLPFYVGKGSNDRMYQHHRDALKESYTNKRSVHSKITSIVNKGGTVLYEQFFHNTEQEAFDHEMLLIVQYGRKDINTGILCNLTAGGEGTHQSPESIERRAAKHRGMKRSEESKQRMKTAQLNNANINRQLFGKGCSPQTSANMSLSRKGKSWSDIARAVKRYSPTAKPVLVYYKSTNEFVGEWDSISACARALNCDHSAIWKICKGDWMSKTPTGVLAPFKSHKGYIFKYKIHDSPTPHSLDLLINPDA